MAGLSSQTLCNLYTLEQIESKVTFYQEQLDNATVKSYNKDSSQGSQKVESAEINRIADILQSWLKAWELKKGMRSVRIVSANYQGHN